MFALRLFVAGWLTLTLVACSIDKAPAPKTDDPPAQDTPKAEPPPPAAPSEPVPAEDPSRTEREKAKREAQDKDIQAAFTSVREGLHERHELVDRLVSGEFDSDAPATKSPASPVTGVPTRIQQLLLKEMALVKTEGEQKFLAALAENDLSVYSRYGVVSNGGIFTLLIYGNEERTAFVRDLIEAGVTKNIDLADDDGDTPLHLAKSAATVDLLSPFTSPWVQNKEGQTPLVYMLAFQFKAWPRMLQKTCENGAVLRSLFNTPSPVNVADKNGRVALHYAAQKGNLVAVREILECGGSKIALKDKNLQTALHLAAGSMHGANATADAILEAAKTRVAPLSMFIDAQDSNLDTALHIAFRCENKALIDLFKFYGARTDLKNKKGETALEQTSYDCPYE